MIYIKLLVILLALINSSWASQFSCVLDNSEKICTLKNLQYENVSSNNTPNDKIKTLLIKETKLAKVPQKIFSYFPQLLELDLSKNAFTELSFGETMNDLTTLDASRNDLTALTENVFTKTPKLKELHLQWNQIQSLPSTVFSGMAKLELLDLSHNQIKTILGNVFGQLRNLRFLCINHNNMEASQLDLRYSSNLMVVDASHNNYKELVISLALGSKVKLRLAYCGLNGSYIIEGKEFDLEGNKIEILEITETVRRVRANNNNIRQVEIKPWIELKSFELSNNNITDISNITKVQYLQVLDLSGNDLKGNVQSDTFWRLNALTHLNLQRTGVMITPKLFERNTHLMFLDLSNNGLGNFDLRDLKYLTNLKILRLDSNEIAELFGYEDLKEILPELTTIGVSNNTFSCSYLHKLTKALSDADVEVSVPTSTLEFISPNIRGIKCIQDGTNVADQLGSMGNNIQGASLHIGLQYGIIVVSAFLVVVIGSLLAMFLKKKLKRAPTNTLAME